ncbi:ADP-ribosylglycohydrolase family protein [Halomonas llamarensis]|uniref:ADP-ribosylglycohydrolase family protein n=1 Tax=Halomonas llamarensis TaxID=2945104 RepID=A0ABT0ST92_9GAMM|nr:ADP-ribosylglycohydrolase family protein [Halomonas llamarensis]MCL7931060.1 ADP-ribosylglycohydrolase family protein [Halomonas llamarensis]
MIGAITGDMVGSMYEHQPIKTKDFPLFSPRSCFTDDSVLTVAVASAILNDTPYAEAVRQIGRQYPNAGYGGSFIQWLTGPNAGPYYSWGNGAAMRVSPVGFAYATEADVLAQAKATAEITHNHPEGIKGAQATALAVFWARTGADKATIRETLTQRFDYDLARTLADIRPRYRFDVSCQGSVPEAIIAFLEANSYEDALRNAVSLGGDSDTQACIAGGIAEAFYGVPDTLYTEVKHRLTPGLWAITDAFCQRYR